MRRGLGCVEEPPAHGRGRRLRLGNNRCDKCNLAFLLGVNAPQLQPGVVLRKNQSKPYKPQQKFAPRPAKPTTQPKVAVVKASKYKAPADMHPRLAKLVISGQACGASLHFGRGYCSNKPAVHGLRRLRGEEPPYRCRFHGGLSTGVVGNQNARKTLGLYADLLLPGEEKWLDELATDDLSFEISMMKVRLRRIAEAEVHHSSSPHSPLAETHTKREREALPRKKGAKGPPKYVMTVTETTKVHKTPDFAHAMSVAARQLVKMMETQALLKGKGGFSDEARKEMARDFIRQIKAKAADSSAPLKAPVNEDEEKD